MKKILVVDNHRVIREFMTNFLEKKGYHVITAEDGLTALETLKTYVPDVMFVDLIMPNIGLSRSTLTPYATAKTSISPSFQVSLPRRKSRLLNSAPTPVSPKAPLISWQKMF